METLTLEEQMESFWRSRQDLNTFYEDYAKSVGFSYTSLEILYFVFSNQEDCTQKTICQQTFLPKQTVNAIITGLLKQGIIELKEMESDRRSKIIRLTETGKIYAGQFISKLKNAEYKAFEKLEPEQRIILTDSMKRYKDNFRKYLLND